MRPLRCSMRLGFQGTSKWNRFAAVGLKVEPFAGRVGGDQNAHRMLAGVGIEGALDVLAFILAVWSRGRSAMRSSA